MGQVQRRDPGEDQKQHGFFVTEKQKYVCLADYEFSGVQVS